ncbi:MAG: hypothetical protein H7Z40_16920 [Phycisphaerae bacterium]|nr:hypothetical protein [Gemmatimonadaceae bacterium]
MAVFISAVVPNQTTSGYDGMLNKLEDSLRQAPGFVAHFAYSSDGTWHTAEIWESARQASDFFANFVHPNLPPGVKPKRTVHELHSLVKE